MADVHVFDILAVAHGAAGFVGNIVNRPEGIGIGEQIVSAVHTVVDPPDHLGAVPEVLPDFCQHFIVQAAVVQNEPLAVIQHRQSPADFRFAFVADFLIFVFHGFISGGQGLAEEGKAVVEGHPLGGILKLGHILQSQAFSQFHIGQMGEKAQLLTGFRYLAGSHGGQIQGGHILP